MLTKLLAKIVAGKKEPYVFLPYRENIDFSQAPESLGLYLHIPFCRQLCPFCPYNKVKYQQQLVAEYAQALNRELEMVADMLPGRRMESVYFGGGTPTLMLEEIGNIMEVIRGRWGAVNQAGIEVHPMEGTPALFRRLKKLGFTQVSIGVQTFDDELLQRLGRNYTGQQARTALAAAVETGFDCVDADIMFNLPGQSMSGARSDLEQCFKMGVDQLSHYPLILFPMTNLGQKVSQQNYSLFSARQEYILLRDTKSIANDHGYNKASVWTYAKPQAPAYTSVTRESFVGLGAGATSQFANFFYLNTFDVAAYIDRVNQGRLPVNLVNTMSPRERQAYWLFWRCYENKIDLTRFQQLFGAPLKRELPGLYRLMKGLGVARRQEGFLVLTSFGSFLYHLVEKHYSLTYLNDMWQASREQPWLDGYRL